MMPFGATLTEDGAAFALWAPDAEAVALEIEGRGPIQAVADENGWCRVQVAGVRAGDLYRYRIDGALLVPDPASRFQPRDVDGPSEVVDPDAYSWRTENWRGRPWHEAVVRETHVGTASEAGTYEALTAQMPALARLGITALQLMPLAAVPGGRNWGYDGVLPYAPDDSYGTPDELKALIDTAHEHGVMVLLDVVYNHYGPSGNYLHAYAKRGFDEGAPTPWGAAIDVASPGNRPVREFMIQNALYWIGEYRFDGLRLDAVHAIPDASDEHVLEELARRVREAHPDRHVHLILENEHNDAKLLRRADEKPARYTAQWNDDYHHCWHTLLTGESDSYYAGYADAPRALLAKCLGSGFAYQGDHYGPLGRGRGTPSGHLPPGAFINFVQNHDQIGNRAFGDRLTTLVGRHRLEIALAATLLAPFPPMLFQGEETFDTAPFLFFCDFTDPALQDAVREGRKREFAAFPQFRARIDELSDATEEKTFRLSKIDANREPDPFIATVLRLRHERVIPVLASGWRGSEAQEIDGVVEAAWTYGAAKLRMRLTLDADRPRDDLPGTPLFSLNPETRWGFEFTLDDRSEAGT